MTTDRSPLPLRVCVWRDRVGSPAVKSGLLVTPVGSAVWCMVFALAILAVLMLDRWITKLEKDERRR